MTEPRSDIFSIAELRVFQSMAITFFLEEILTAKQYFSPKTIRKRFLRQLHLRKSVKYELKNRVSQYTRSTLMTLQSNCAVIPFSNSSYQILDKQKIEEIYARII